MALTGRFNFKRSWFGKLMLEVEDEVNPVFWSERKPLKRHWRRATLIDLAQPEMRPLIDLRFQWQFMARTPVRIVEPVPPGASRTGAAAGGDGGPPHRDDAARQRSVSTTRAELAAGRFTIFVERWCREWHVSA